MSTVTSTGAINNVISGIGELAFFDSFGAATATSFGLANFDLSVRYVFTGSGFGAYLDGVPTVGTITGVQRTLNGVTTTVAGFSNSVANFNLWVATSNDAAVQNALIGGADTIAGSAASDSIRGYGGNDVLSSGGGNDSIDGGSGDDTINISGAYTSIFAQGGPGNDTINLSATGVIFNPSISGGGGLDTLNINAMQQDVLNFGLSAPSFSTISYNAGRDLELQFGSTDQSPTATIIGDAFANTFRMSTLSALVGAFSLAGLSLQNWTNADLLQFNWHQGNSDWLIYQAGGGGGAPTITGSSGSDRLIGNSQVNTIHGGGADDILEGGNSTDQLFGDEGNDILMFGAGSTLDGGAGTDALGIAGGTTFATSPLTLTSIERLVFMPEASATVTILASIINQLAAPLIVGATQTADFIPIEQHLTIQLTPGSPFDAGALQLQNWGANNTVALQGSLGDDVGTGFATGETFDGLDGNDVFHAGGGNDTVQGGDGSDMLFGDAGDDVLRGDPLFTFQTSNDQLFGGDGDDTLEGGNGDDVLTGGPGNDTYLDVNITDTVVELADEGVDEVRTFQFSLTLAANVENGVLLTTSPSSFDPIALTGNALNNRLTGSAFADILDGLAGADTMIGGLGNDIYVVDDALDVTIEAPGEGQDRIRSSISISLAERANIEELELTGAVSVNGEGNGANNQLIGNAGANALTGGGGADILQGNGGDDLLDGGTGDDSMDGGAGADTFIVDSQLDSVSDSAGFDTVIVAANFVGTFYTLHAFSGIEKLTILGTAPINGNGNQENNTIEGNSGANVLRGAEGDDILYGFDGDDTLRGDDGFLQGDDQLFGGAGDDFLYGDVGADYMEGGTGNDIYDEVDSFDTIVELPGEGIDEVRVAGGPLVLPDNVENGVLTSAGGTITGNALNNRLTGAAGNDILDSQAGTDTLIGGDGNDIYIIDTALDVVIEEADGGAADQINGALTISLANRANVERIQLLGTGDFNATGNTLRNTLLGNSGANIIDGREGNDVLSGFAGDDVLIGGAGDDIMFGGLGDDVYFVDSIDDLIGESANEGVDTIRTTITLTIRSNVENLTMLGAGAINATGNVLANIINGNDADNVIDGLDGADAIAGFGGDDMLIGGGSPDSLNGGAGDDIMIGGLGADKYTVDSAGDVVTELFNQGIDSVSSTVSFTLGDNVEYLTLTGAAAINGTGNALTNVILGNDAANVISGLDGRDNLQGFGGDGADSFVFNAALNSITNVDTILDFTVGQDKIVLDSAVFTALAPGALDPGAFHVVTTGHAAGALDDRIIYNQSNGALWYDTNGALAGGQFYFAQLTAGLALTDADFLVI
jgi:Ca2+-binding RTX toxin-like protein